LIGKAVLFLKCGFFLVWTPFGGGYGKYFEIKIVSPAGNFMAIL